MGDPSIVQNFYSSPSSVCGSYKILNSSGGPIPARCLASLSIPRHVVSAYKQRTSSSTAKPLLPHCFLAATSSADPSSNELHVLGYEEDTFEVECSARVFHPPEIQALAISSSSSISSTSYHVGRKSEEKNKEEGEEGEEGEEKRKKEREKKSDRSHEDNEEDVLRMPLWFFTAYPHTSRCFNSRSLCSLWRCDVPVPGCMREGEEDEENEEEKKKKNTESLLSSSSASSCPSIERIQPELVVSLRSMKEEKDQKRTERENISSFSRIKQLVVREWSGSSGGGGEEGRAAGEKGGGGEEREKEKEEDKTKEGERKSRRRKKEEGKEEHLLVVMNKTMQLFSVTSDGSYQGLLEIRASRGGSIQAAAFDPHHKDVVFMAESFCDSFGGGYTGESEREEEGGVCDSFIYSNGGGIRIVDIRTPSSLSSSSSCSSSSSSRSFTTFYQRGRNPSLKSFAFSSSSSPSPCMDGCDSVDQANGDSYYYSCSSSPFSFSPAPLSIDCNENLPFSLVTGSSDGSVMYWDSRLLSRPLMVLQDVHSHWVTRVKLNAFHDQLLLTASTDNTVKLHHVEPSTASNAALASSFSSSSSSSSFMMTPGVGSYTRHIVLEIQQEEDEGEGEEAEENEKRDSEGLSSSSFEPSSYLPHNADAGAGRGPLSVSSCKQRKEEEQKEKEGQEERKISGREKTKKNRKRQENYTISSYEGSEDVIADLAWAGDDAWICASLSADGQISFHHVPSKEKYSILL